VSDRLAQLAELAKWSASHGLDLTPAQRDSLHKYLELLDIWSVRLALVGAAERPLLVRKHLADSLFAAAHCPTGGCGADLGSGAGLPGIPVAIARPRLNIDLVESRGKKVSFLIQATQDIPNATPVGRRIESLAPAAYDFVLARALAPLERLLPMCVPLLRSGGTILALKSSSFRDELARVDLEDAGLELAEVLSYDLPSGESRELLKLIAVCRST